MTRHSRSITALIVTTVVLGTIGIAGGSNPPTPQTGQATTVIQFPRIAITDAAGVVHTIDLGALTAQALTDTDLVASLGVGAWSVDSSGGPQSGDHDLADVHLVGYDVNAVGDTAHSSLDALTATAATSPLAVQVDLGQHGVDATVDSATSSSTINLTVSGLTIGMGDLLPADALDALPLSGLIDLVSGLGLTLPAGASGVVSQLGSLTDELSDVSDAANDLQAAQTTLAGLLASIPSTTAAQQQLTDAQTQLTNDLASLLIAQQQLGIDTTTAQTLQTQLDAANADVADLTTQVNDLTALLATLIGDPLKALQAAQVTAQLQAAQAALTAAQATATQLQQDVDQANATVAADQQVVTTLTQQVSADQAAVTAAQDALDLLADQVALGNQAVADAQAVVDQLTTTLTDLIDGLTTDLGGLPDLTALRTQLVAALTAAPLLDVGTLGATLSSTAADGSGAGAVTCTVTGASVLGQPIPVGPCSDLVSSFAAITSTVAGALAQLPLAQSLTPALGGLAASDAGSTPAPNDVDTTGSAALTPLHLNVPAGTLAALTDPAVAALTGALTPTQQALAGLGLPSLTAALTGSLGTLGSALAAMPSGSALAGLHTIGVDVTLVGLSTSALHHRALPAAPPGGGSGGGTGGGGGSGGGSAGGAGGSAGGTGGGGTTSGPAEPGDPANPADPPAQDPRPPAAGVTPPHQVTAHSPLPALPFTGDNVALDVAAALLLALAGAHLLTLTSKRSWGC
jgi:hypothetical protein